MTAIIEFWKSTKSAMMPTRTAYDKFEGRWSKDQRTVKKTLGEKFGLRRGNDTSTLQSSRVTKENETINGQGCNEASWSAQRSPSQRGESPPTRWDRVSSDSHRSASSSRKAPSLKSDYESARRVASVENGSDGEGFIDIEDFAVHGTAGEGSFGTVFKATWKENGTVVALKALRPREDFLSIVPEDELRSVYKNICDAFKREIKFLELSGSHPNVISIYGKSKDSKLCALEIACCDLFQLVRTARKSLPLSIAHTVATGVLAGVAHLHSIGIIHQDIKSSNILLDEQGTAKLCDFGLAIATRGEVKVDREIITLWYRAPELLMGCASYDCRVDDWAVGCILLEMIVGGVAFPGDPKEACTCSSHRHLNFNRDQLGRIFKVVGTPAVDPKAYTCHGHFGRWPTLKPCLNRLISDCCKERGPAPRQARNAPAAMCPPDKSSISEWTAVISDLLQIHPESRITCSEAIDYPIFRQAQRSSLRSSAGKILPSPVRLPSSNDSDCSSLSSSGRRTVSPISSAQGSRCLKRGSQSGGIGSPPPTIKSAEQLLRHLVRQDERQLSSAAKLPSLNIALGEHAQSERAAARGMESRLVRKDPEPGLR